jgi:hypothetical protein
MDEKLYKFLLETPDFKREFERPRHGNSIFKKS